MPSQFPLPPLELAARVGGTHANAYEGYEEIGARMRDEIMSALPAGWTFDGRTVLDFGCGAGRTLRHFGDVAEHATVLGCDIDVPSIEWLRRELSPPFQIFLAPEQPPLDLEDRSVDLIWAISVFSHLTDHWSAWLSELHRVLTDEGILLATYIGPGAAAWVTDEEWDDERIGMNVLRYDQGWHLGGPMVMHSAWWLRTHWQRGFDIVELRESGFATDGEGGQGVVLMRKRPGTLTATELERIDPTEPREIAALQHQIAQLRHESASARYDVQWLLAELEGTRQEAARLDAEPRTSPAMTSRSWWNLRRR